jgi:hypothetical protein
MLVPAGVFMYHLHRPCGYVDDLSMEGAGMKQPYLLFLMPAYLGR